MVVVIRDGRRIVVDEDDFRDDVIAGSFVKGKDLPNTGGDMLLPAAALLLGSGVLTYAILRRRP